MGTIENAVLVHLKLSNDALGENDERVLIESLEDRLDSILKSKGVGEFDGHEIGMGTCTLYMYGLDADLLFGAIESTLRETPIINGSYAIKRYGPAGDPDAREVRVLL